MAKHIAFYGKGGVGKSTLIANISAAMAEAGFKVLQIGCDPKADSGNTLNSGMEVPTLFERLAGNQEVSLDSLITTGFKGISCIELGDPYLSDGCASEQIAKAFRTLNRIGLFEQLKADFVLYDLSGEIACGRYHLQIQKYVSQTAYLVTNADFMSLQSANSILKNLARYGESNLPITLGGMIPNNIANSFEESFIADFARHANTRTLGRIPKSLIVRQYELFGKTVIEGAPLSNQAYFYRRLADQIVDNAGISTIHSSPRPMDGEKLKNWAQEWGNRIYAMENGLVNDGAAI